MAADLNRFFVTFKIFRDNVQVHSIECPCSQIQTMMLTWKYAGSPYVVHVVDHNNNFRFNSDILNSMELR